MDSPHCKTFVDNIQTAFNTKMPPKSVLLQGEAVRSGGDLSAGERSRAGWSGDGKLQQEGRPGVTSHCRAQRGGVGAHGTAAYMCQ